VAELDPAIYVFLTITVLIKKQWTARS